MDYQLIPAVGTTDADGITHFTNRPAGAPLFYQTDTGGWVPVGEASPTTPGQATGYTDAQIDAFLATKLGTITEETQTAAYGPVNSLTSADFNKKHLLATSQDTVLNLPTPTSADLGKLLVIENYGGSSSAATVTYQATLLNGAGVPDSSATSYLSHARHYTAAFLVVTKERGYPYNDTVATYTVLYNLPTDLSVQFDTLRTTLSVTLTRTADYTLALPDAGCLVPVSSTSAVTVTVPAHADVAFPVGTTLYVAQDGAGQVSIAPASGVVVQTAGGLKVGGQWTDVALHKRDLNTWVLKGGV
jgi:hypothetical protein